MNKSVLFLAGILSVFILGTNPSYGKDLEGNSFTIHNPPTWLTRSRADRIVSRISNRLEWTIRKINIHWYKDAGAFAAVNSGGPLVQAFARRQDNSVHMGPRVNSSNFDEVFGHELSHIISYQKYKESIPSWLEEGLANHVSRKEKVDYKWLNKQRYPTDITKLKHPIDSSLSQAKYQYVASQALVELLDRKCNLQTLLQLSVGDKLENYLKTTCEITDLTKAFKQWVAKKAK